MKLVWFIPTYTAPTYFFTIPLHLFSYFTTRHPLLHLHLLLYQSPLHFSFPTPSYFSSTTHFATIKWNLYSAPLLILPPLAYQLHHYISSPISQLTILYYTISYFSNHSHSTIPFLFAPTSTHPHFSTAYFPPIPLIVPPLKFPTPPLLGKKYDKHRVGQIMFFWINYSRAYKFDPPWVCLWKMVVE